MLILKCPICDYEEEINTNESCTNCKISFEYLKTLSFSEIDKLRNLYFRNNKKRTIIIGNYIDRSSNLNIEKHHIIENIK